MIDCPICASGNIEHRDTHQLTMTNDEAQDWLLAQHNAAPGPPDPARFGAAIRAIRAKAIADTKEWYGVDDAAIIVFDEGTEPDRSLVAGWSATVSDPDSPQCEDCKVCGGDHWTKDHPR